MVTAEKTLQKEIGFVVDAKGYLLSLEGLPSARINDIIEDDNGNRAIVFSIEKDYVRVLLLSNILSKAGDRFFLSRSKLLFSLGEHLFGRIVDPFGIPIDSAGSFPKGDSALEFDRAAPGIHTRKEIDQSLQTGITLIDTLFPIGKGQRQLLFGPTGSGKTTFIRDVIVNQKNKNVICIYVGIGKPFSYIERFASSLFSRGADSYSVIMSAFANDITPINIITPTAGMLIAEYFADRGRDVLLILDDLGTHAKYLREVALLMEMIPGRQSYPGDIFYQHAHLVERAGNFNEHAGNGSITLLPVLETDIENFTDLIPTNLMAMTDGHLFFSPALRAEGYYPSIAIDQSVTRVGRQTQTLLQKQLSTRVMVLLTEYKKQQEYTQFGTSVSLKTRHVLQQGALAHELLRQDPLSSLRYETQIIFLCLLFNTFLSHREASFTKKNREKIITAVQTDSRLEGVRSLAKASGTTLDAMLKELDKNARVLESICQP